MSTETLRRTIHPEVRILSESDGLSEYIASDETIDSYAEVIRVDGWRFDLFKKNSPFVNSHDYSSIESLLGSVVDYCIRNGALVTTVQWALDVPENRLAQLGWKMTQAGHLKAVSVGFRPMEWVFPQDASEFAAQCLDLGLDQSKVRRIFTEQQLLELSAVVLGANPQAVALAYKSGVINDSDLELFADCSQWRDTRASEFNRASTQTFLDRFEAAVYRL